MSVSDILLYAGFWLVFAALIVTLWPLCKGPQTLDRVNALNMLGNLLVALFIVLAVIFKEKLLLEISFITCLAGFIPIVAMAHYLLRRDGR